MDRAAASDARGAVVLVTGASSGIGAHAARVYGRAGFRVVIGARRAERLAETAAAVAAEGGTVQAVGLDVTDAASVAAAFDAAAAGLGAVDVLVNNAGVAPAASALEMTEDAWSGVMRTNLTGAWLVAREFARRAVADGRGGAVINVASIVGLQPGAGLAAYGASKAALLHLTTSLALEWARYGIRVNALAPGYIETDLNAAFFATEAGKALVRRIPQRRLGTFADLDGALLLLATQASAYMTGSVITIDGGHVLAGGA